MSTPVSLTTAGLAGNADTPVGPLNPIPTSDATGYPAGITQITGASGNVANAAAIATLANAAAKTNFLAGFEISGAGATAALPVTVTVTGLLGGTLTYIYTFAAGPLVGNLPLVVEFNPPLQASAVNTPIVVTCPAGGAGNTNNAAVAHGYQG